MHLLDRRQQALLVTIAQVDSLAEVAIGNRPGYLHCVSRLAAQQASDVTGDDQRHTPRQQSAKHAQRHDQIQTSVEGLITGLDFLGNRGNLIIGEFL